MITANELRNLFIDFFTKKHEHAKISGASLIPENDPTVLFTTAGMHPLVPFLMGERHPGGKRLVNVQKCVRTGDIEEVGDNTHLTFFEMLGNWSLGDYFKEEAIKMSFEFLTSSRADGGLGIDLKDLAVTCFTGDENAPRDDESAGIWRSLGVSDDRLAFLGKADNWWGPAGQTGPCGPDTEIFYWTGDGEAPTVFDPEDARWVEIWNNVFMQYFKNDKGEFLPLEQTNVDTGMGLERVLAVLNGKKSAFETELFEELIEEVRMLGRYDKELSDEEREAERIIVDHVRAATFMLGDPVPLSPSNNDQGYVLRRLIRRAIRYGRELGIEGFFMRKLAGIVVKNYGEFYGELLENQERIFEEMANEETRFGQTLDRGMGVLKKEMERLSGEKSKGIMAFADDFVFDMFATYGFPLEMTLEEMKKKGWISNDKDLNVLTNNFNQNFEKHQALSRAGADKKFSGGLADHHEETVKLHTATHLLHQALKDVLGDEINQKGSNITQERLRFDFNFERAMTAEEKAQVEEIVNSQIKAALPVSYEEMTVEEAQAKNAIGLFGAKYGEVVKVYKMGEGAMRGENVFSMEICGGPHVANTLELGTFKIAKEESVGSGVRRIKAVLK